MASVAKLKDTIQNMKASQARARVRRKGEQLTHTVVGGAAAFAFGRLERTAALPSVFGIDPKLVWGIGAHMVSATASGKLGDMMGAVGDGLIASYGYAEGKGGMSGLGGLETPDDFEAV